VRVLAFGTYQRDYPRFTQAVAAMRAAGVDVVERHRPVWDGRRGSWRLTPGTLGRLAAAEVALLPRGGDDADVLYVGYPGHPDLPAARRVAGGRPIVFDPLVSLHDTLVEDRRRFRPGTVGARFLRRLDRYAFRAADVVVADTTAHARFFAAVYGLAPERLAVCRVGADDELFRPAQRPQPAYDALFVGTLIPLHGLETILAAARLAPELRLRVVGDGQLRALLESRPANVDWTPWLPYAELPAAYRGAACALGIFGTGAKAGRVVPNKAYQALATASPLVTADTPAARELLADGRDAILVPPGDAVALAAALQRLAGDPAERARLGAGGRATYEQRASLRVLAETWRCLLARVAG
jgi:glycosyltransferase involved in cell wall biosynthesis